MSAFVSNLIDLEERRFVSVLDRLLERERLEIKAVRSAYGMMFLVVRPCSSFAAFEVTVERSPREPPRECLGRVVEKVREACGG